ncbi:hypothetical protein IHQ68_04025 [Chelatococcus sambhunathii]|uniref:SMP-30/Gluconolactonase/LRE-like region domain-containing protein n=1 Tax=Chelatococcus sambhunathii TaxID=363953 RepID=A0ABU1DCJ1_9HYPH|nr:choice-of-anchor tandem repeat GloVer-containing protein [Chelatococcus sambhunathii]MDR4305792.1 hypothetical protein [Chelatococcus sambhunathii]
MAFEVKFERADADAAVTSAKGDDDKPWMRFTGVDRYKAFINSLNGGWPLNFWEIMTRSFYFMKPGSTPEAGERQTEAKAALRLRDIGTAQLGGDDDCVITSGGCGTVFVLAPPGAVPPEDIWNLHSFLGGEDGAFPAAGVILGPDDSIYGVTREGGGACALARFHGCGVVFQLRPPRTREDKWSYSVLTHFRGGDDGAVPVGRLVIDGKGALYGATLYGGGCAARADGCGAIFKLVPPKAPGKRWKRTILHRFQAAEDGSQPTGGLTVDAAGAVYGTTADTIFRIAP